MSASEAYRALRWASENAHILLCRDVTDCSAYHVFFVRGVPLAVVIQHDAQRLRLHANMDMLATCGICVKMNTDLCKEFGI